MKCALILAGLSACAHEPSTPLAELAKAFGDTKLEIVANGQINVELHVTGDGCPMLGDDVVATFDGAPMNITPGGYATDATGCYPIAFWISPLPIARMASWERSTSRSDLVIADASATWTIASTRLFTNDFEDDPAAARIVWRNISQIATASLDPRVPIQIDGNVVSYPPGTLVSSVHAYAHPTPMRCDGPASCVVDLEGSRKFGPAAP